MGGQAVFGFAPESMFSVQLREAVAKKDGTIAFALNMEEFRARLSQVLPALVIVDLLAAGADSTEIIHLSTQIGSKVIGFAPPSQIDVMTRAERDGCHAVYPSSKFKMDLESILSEWLY